MGEYPCRTTTPPATVRDDLASHAADTLVASLGGNLSAAGLEDLARMLLEDYDRFEGEADELEAVVAELRDRARFARKARNARQRN